MQLGRASRSRRPSGGCGRTSATNRHPTWPVWRCSDETAPLRRRARPRPPVRRGGRSRRQPVAAPAVHRGGHEARDGARPPPLRFRGGLEARPASEGQPTLHGRPRRVELRPDGEGQSLVYLSRRRDERRLGGRCVQVGRGGAQGLERLDALASRHVPRAECARRVREEGVRAARVVENPDCPRRARSARSTTGTSSRFARRRRAIWSSTSSRSAADG